MTTTMKIWLQISYVIKIETTIILCDDDDDDDDIDDVDFHLETAPLCRIPSVPVVGLCPHESVDTALINWRQVSAALVIEVVVCLWTESITLPSISALVKRANGGDTVCPS